MSAWLAIACLFLQLVASATCCIGAGTAAAALDQSHFPICHALTGDEDAAPPASGQHPQPHQHTCPFCAAHGHVAVALPSPVAIVTPFAVVAAPAAPPSFRMAPPARFAVGAPPRGPPARA